MATTSRIPGAKPAPASAPTTTKPNPPPAVAPKPQAPAYTFGASFDNAPAPSAGVWIEPGNHLISIGKVKPLVSVKDGRAKSLIIVEGVIVESDTQAVGANVSYCYDPAYIGFESDFKGFAAAALNMEPREVKAEHANMCLFDDSARNEDGTPATPPLAGTLVQCIAWYKDTKPKNGAPAGKFTKVQWLAVPDAEPSA